MKASELILQLAEMVDDHGDGEVITFGGKPVEGIDIGTETETEKPVYLLEN